VSACMAAGQRANGLCGRISRDFYGLTLRFRARRRGECVQRD
jgi:hypothetical protein